MRKIAYAIASLIVLGVTGVCGVVLWHVWPWASLLPNRDELMALNADTLACTQDKIQHPIPPASIPPAVADVFITSDDKDFWNRPPSNPVLGIGNAILFNHPPPAAGISDYVTRHIVSCLPGKGRLRWERGWLELNIIMLYRLDRELPRARILELFLNSIYLGRGAYGVSAGAEVYFAKSLTDLRLSEIAFLVAAARSPNLACKNPDRVLELRNSALDQLAKLGRVTSAEADLAKAEPLSVRCTDAAPGH